MSLQQLGIEHFHTESGSTVACSTIRALVFLLAAPRRLDFTANAEVILEERPNALIIPEAAVTYDDHKAAFVDVADPGADGGRRKVPVKLGIGNGTRTQVIDGLKAGDRVVLPG